MRELLIPATVRIENVDYSVNVQFLQDDVISTIFDRYENSQSHDIATFSVDFRERAEHMATLDQAKNWLLNQLVTINPFVFTDHQPYIGSDVTSVTMSQVFDTFNVEPVKLATTGDQPTTMTFLNGTTTSTHLHNTTSHITGNACNIFYYGGWTLGRFYGNFPTTDGAIIYWEFDKCFFPTSSFRDGMFKDTTASFYILRCNFNGRVAVLGTATSVLVNTISCTIYKLNSTAFKNWSVYGDLIDVPFENLGATAQGFSGENPYEISPSSVGGGYGSGVITPSDLIDDPEPPDIDAISTGLLTIFKPTLSQIQSLGDYLWSNAFDVDTLKKLFGDPMDAIIGLSIVPVNPPAGGSKNVKVGNIDTGISMSYLSRQFVEKDLGSLSIDPYIGSFMDYSPYTKIQIYLPYIGFRELSPEDVMGTTISIKYIIDVLTGGCNAILNVSGKGAIYQFNGSCIANVPLTALNYSGAIQNAISAVGSLVTAGAGVASGNPALAGVGVVGLATRATNAVINTKPTIQRSGNAGGASGLCGVQYAYAIIERPRLSTPANYNGFIGNTLNVTMTIGSCDGLTMVEAIHLDNVLCTENEREELMKMLHEGVIIHVPAPEPEPTPNNSEVTEGSDNE